MAPKAFSIPTDNFVRLEDLSDCRFIQYPEFPRPSLADQIFDLCAEQGFEVRRKDYTQDIHTALSLVAAGNGVSIVPASNGVHCWRGLRALTIEPDLGVTKLYLNSRLDDQEPHSNNFVKIAQSVSRRLGEQAGNDRVSA